MMIKHVVRPEDREVPGGGWARCWSVYALRETGAVEVAQSIPTRAKARQLARELTDRETAPSALASYRPMMLVGEWCGNALRFATREEAEASARDLFSRWTLPTDWRVDASDDVPNYAWRDGKLVSLASLEEQPS